MRHCVSFPFTVLVPVPTALIRIQLPANALEEAGEDGPRNLGSSHLGGRCELSFWLPLGPGMAAVAIWEASQLMENLMFALALSLLNK